MHSVNEEANQRKDEFLAMPDPDGSEQIHSENFAARSTRRGHQPSAAQTFRDDDRRDERLVWRRRPRRSDERLVLVKPVEPATLGEVLCPLHQAPRHLAGVSC
jgi:hypothetical protein